MSLLTPLLIGVSMVGGTGPSLEAVVAENPAVILQVEHSCSAPCQTVCQPACNPCHVSNPTDPCSWCNPCSACSTCNSCQACCHGMSLRDCVECNNDSPALKFSSCNLHPHYAYRPQCHGYWAFRAYNWVHIDQHRLTLAGEDFKFPYSNKIFEQVYAEFEGDLGKANTDQVESIRNDMLPTLEELME
jgi:hypothetical protein